MALWAGFRAIVAGIFVGQKVLLNCHPEPKDSEHPSYIRRVLFPEYATLGSYAGFYVNYLFCYNIKENSWEWPYVKGALPSPRAEHLALVDDGVTFLYGGQNALWETNGDVYPPYRYQEYNDFHILDLDSLTWRQVHGNNEERLPMQQFHTLTSISNSFAVLYGVAWRIPFPLPFEMLVPWRCIDDCWILDLQKAKRGLSRSAIWTRMRSHMLRADHAATLEPVSQTLWVIAGDENPRNTELTSNIIKMSHNLLPLKMLAIDCIKRCLETEDYRLQSDQLPVELMKEIKSYAKRVGEEHWCSQAKGCHKCQFNRDQENNS